MGNKIMELLADKNISQKELAQRLNIAPSTLNGYLKGHRSPDYQTLIALAEFFGVSTDYLLGKKNSPELKPEETKLLNLYNTLSDKNKKLAFDLLSAILKNQ